MHRPFKRQLFAALTLMFLLAAAACTESSDDAEPSDHEPGVDEPGDDEPGVEELADAPAGTRWVGVGDVAFAVPEEWPTDIGHGCGGRSEPAVTFSGESNVTYDCGAPPADYVQPDQMNVDFAPSDADYDDELDVDGITVSFTEECGDDGCVIRWAIDDVDVDGRIRFNGPDAAESAREILESAIRLPEGLVGVPMVGDHVDADDGAKVMEDAGLEPNLDELGTRDDGETPPVHWSDPEPGTIVSVGSEVVLVTPFRTP